ncbi:ComF family protein [Iamia sp. SCSIO 61187]|uniref:ComF family protein n=1 Tax=Iamia sp. SCSIO 61187 TaxID=2722752 RepID=UPI001C62D334|nr:phosphoribosyltransferase family protein [Iamia sp. SCSIO 61187]QYG92432.1 ComF family protein [Iamia sp. SCSIO 61187]
MLLAARCASCGRSGASPCRACHAELRPPAPEPAPPGLAGLVTLLRYEGPARPLVARLKYRNHRQGLGWLAAGLARRVTEAGVTVDLVTWAPTTARHRRERGFDHAELLARAVARELGVGCRPLLHRRPGPPQTGRPAAARRTVGPRFALREGLAAGTRVLVVDDVVTTGATLRAAVAAVARGGGRPTPAAVARTPAPH